MLNNKTFLAIIPARSGSKGLPDKNIMEINHMPLIAYTIKACIDAGFFDDVLVSTDSFKYAEIARYWGASVPFLRPEVLGLDETTTNEVMLHVIGEMKKRGKVFDYLVLLQPTSPLRGGKHIRESAELLLLKKADAVISVCKLSHPSGLNVTIDKEGKLLVPFLKKESVRRQDFLEEYRINGGIYITSTDLFLQNGSFYAGNIYPYVMEEKDSVDIDDRFGFRIAELLLTYGYKEWQE